MQTDAEVQQQGKALPSLDELCFRTFSRRGAKLAAKHLFWVPNSSHQCLRGDGWEPPIPKKGRQGEAFEASPLSLEQAVGIGQNSEGHPLLAFLVGVL